MECNFFGPGSVVWDLKSTDKFEAIRELVHAAPIYRSIPSFDVGDFANRVVTREYEQSTGFGHGIAISHGRTEQVSRSVVSLGISRNGIDFDSVDGEPVHTLFVVATHPEHHVDYLRVLSTLAYVARDPRFHDNILTCVCIEEVERRLSVALSRVLRRRWVA